MTDWISLLHKIHRRLRSGELFAFRPERYDRTGPLADPLRERQTRLGARLGTRLFSRRYAGVTGRIHIHDTMLQDDSPAQLKEYIHIGQSAMRNIEVALSRAGRRWDNIHAALDMGCGYGRVLRLLVQRIAPAKVTACDIVEEAVSFCAEEFGARPMPSRVDLDRLVFPTSYDLIWAGSLLTHLVPEEGLVLLETLAAALKPGGLLLFSTQGPGCLELLPYYGCMFEDQAGPFRRLLDERGAAYRAYFPANPR